MRFAAFLMVAFAADPISAQTMTPEEFLAKLDERVAELSPFEQALNDPDPLRSLAAMDIMIKSGDPILIDMARDYGLTSPNPRVRRKATEAHFATQPALRINLIGKDVSDTDFRSSVVASGGSIDAEMNGSIPIYIGQFSEELKCYLDAAKGDCVAWINSEGIVVKFPDRRYSASFVAAGAGSYKGSASLYAVNDVIPATLTLVN